MSEIPRRAEELIRYLELEPHPEGGYFREVYRSDERLPRHVLPERYRGDRAFATSIYFLISGRQVSRLHRLCSDEVWHFYEGSGVRIHVFDDDDRYHELRLGADHTRSESYQVVVPGRTWFGVHLTDETSFALAGCTVAPGFEYADFTMANAEELLNRFPDHKAVIRRLL